MRNRQLQLLAQSRLPQYLKGSEILESFSRAKNESQVVVNEKGDFCREVVKNVMCSRFS